MTMNANRRHRLAQIGRERARRRTCPVCNRGNAMARVRSADGVIVGRKCRFCGHEKVSTLE